MTVTFDPDIDGLMAFKKYFSETSRMLRRTRRGAVIAPITLFVLCAFMMSGGKSAEFRIFTIIYFGVVSLLVAIFLPVMMKRNFLRKCRKQFLRPGN